MKYTVVMSVDLIFRVDADDEQRARELVGSRWANDDWDDWDVTEVDVEERKEGV